MRVILLDLSVKSIHIHKEVDASIGESVHAVAMISSSVNMVDANGVGSQSLHQRRVESALRSVEKGIIGSQLISNT